MVAKIIKIFHKEFHSVNEAAILIGSFILLSQLLALVRDRLFAGNFGTGIELDIYYAAFKIPDLVFVMVASLVSVTILIPFFVKKLNKNGEDEIQAKRFIDQVFSVFSLFIILVCIVVAIFLPQLISLVAPGFDEVAKETTVMLSRVMLFSPILLGFSNLAGTITQTFKKVFSYALSPVLYNIGIILGIYFFYPSLGMIGLGCGVILGAALHLAIQIPTILQHGMFPKITFHIEWREIFSIVKTSIPRTFALALSSLVFIVIMAFASKLGEGAISVLNLSKNLQNVPLALIGVSFSVAAFPVLVEYLSSKKMEEFVAHIINPMKQIIFWSIPVTIGFIVLRAQIVRVIFGTGEFGWNETRLVAATLAVFVISVVAQSLILLLVKGYYAAGETKKPLSVNFFTSIASIAFALLFVYIFNNISIVQYFFESLLRITDVPGSNVVMLALGYSLGSILNLLILWFMFRKDFPYTKAIQNSLKKTTFQSFGASLIMGVVIYGSLNILSGIFDLNLFWGIFLQGFISGILGIATWVIVLVLLRNEELLSMWKSLHKKFWKDKIFSAEQIM